MNNYNEAEMSNALVTQKNEVFRLINNDEIIKAGELLYLFLPVWKACGYEYKAIELQKIIATRLD